MNGDTRCDVLIIGSGGAALRAAIAAYDRDPSLKVVLVTRGPLGQSGVTAKSCSDRMAFHATLKHTAPGGPDNWVHHADDIFRIGGFVSDEPLAEILARGSRDAFEYLDSIGVPFVKTAEGLPAQFVTDGSEYPRACYTGPYTAVDIERALVKQIKAMPIEVLEGLVAVKILTKSGKASGVVFLREDGDEIPVIIESKAVVLATGGPGQIFETNLFPEESTGSGTGMALRAGAEGVNMEFIQIGLASLATKLACSGSVMRCIPRFLDENGREFLLDHFPGKDPNYVYALVFRKGATWPVSYEHETCLIDVAVHREIGKGHRVYLDFEKNPKGLVFEDLPGDIQKRYRDEMVEDKGAEYRLSSPLNRLREINPPVIRWFADRDIDLAKGHRVEIAPCIQHFQGGIKIGPDAGTKVLGLYAAGEVAGGQHGANRPGGNALMDSQVFGKVAGESAAMHAGSVMAHVGIEVDRDSLWAHLGSGKVPASYGRARLRKIMSMAASVVRTEGSIRRALGEIEAIARDGMLVDEAGLLYAVETELMLDVGRAVLASAVLRKESRGPHLMFESDSSPLPMRRNDEKYSRYVVVGIDAHGAVSAEFREPQRSSRKKSRGGVARAMVLEKFNSPLVMREIGIEVPDGHALIRIGAAGVCGSDVHMYQGKDPRTPLPLILGHEGVGWVEDVKGRFTDVDGKELVEGELVIWDRGLTCGTCRACAIDRAPSLCRTREAYGIHRGASVFPYLNGCYSSHIILRPGTKAISLSSRDAGDIDPAVLVPASCSGATAAHAVEMADIRIGDSVIIFGPGPLGAFLVAFAKARGASKIIVIGGTGQRLDMCVALGATHTINRNATTPAERRDMVMDITHGQGARVVFDAAGSHDAVAEGLAMVAPGGSVSLPGFGVPTGTMPVDIFNSLVRRNVSLVGVWVSDTRHVDEAVALIVHNPEAFGSMITHRFPLEDANAAIEAVRSRQAVKAVLIP